MRSLLEEEKLGSYFGGPLHQQRTAGRLPAADRRHAHLKELMEALRAKRKRHAEQTLALTTRPHPTPNCPSCYPGLPLLS